MGKKLKFLFMIPLILVSMIFGFSIPKIISFANSDQNVDFDNFSFSYKELLKENPYDDYKEISFDLTKDLCKQNNTYMVESSIFASLTGCEISIKSSDEVQISSDESIITLSNNEKLIKIEEEEVDFEIMPENTTIENNCALFPVESVAKSLGFELKFDDNNLILTRPYQTKRLIIKSNSSLDKQGAVRFVEGYDGLHIYQYETEEDTINAYNYYEKLDCVDYVEVDSVVTTASFEDEKINPTGVGDSFSYSSWGAEAMGVEDYSNYLLDTIGSANLPELVVAVLDTGLDSDHDWFENRIADGGANYTSSESKTSYEWEDVYGHGTHVSGIITDLTLNNVKILPIKVMGDNGYGYTSSIVLGMNYVVDKKKDGMNVVAMNMSLGGSGAVGSTDHSSYTNAIDNAYNNNILTIVAAGNEGDDVKNHSPANVTKAITVAAIGLSGQLYYRPSWSNFGTYVDVCAPGYQILSAAVGGGVVSMSGTSMAAPHVAGAVALLYLNSAKNYTKVDIENLLDINSIDLGDKGWDEYYGEGLVNLQYAYAETIDDVIFSHTETDCTDSFELTLTSNEENVKIYYTTDGTIPEIENGNLYSDPILINKTQRIKARAYVLDSNDAVIKYSKVNQMIYCFYGEDVPGAFTVDSEGVLLSYSGILTDVTVPMEVDGITIRKVGENAFSSSKVKSVTLPSSVVEIGSNAFFGCSTIEWVSGFNVKTIGKYAFSNCSKFKYLNDSYFPSLEVIDKFAFFQCFNIHSISLTNLTIVEDYGVYVFMTNNPTPAINLKSINLPNVEIIGAYAFMGANYLSSANLPNVKVVGSEAFRYAGIVNLFLPEAEYLGVHSFYAQDTLKSVNCPKTIFVGSGCFYYEEGITVLNMPKLKYACDFSFRCLRGLTTLYFPELIFADEESFAWCENVESVYMPKLEYAGTNAFQYLAKLESIELPSVRELGNEVFRWYGRDYVLNSITLSPCIESMGINVFLDSEDALNLVVNGYKNTILESYCEKYNIIFNNIETDSVFTYDIVDDEICITGYNSYLEIENLVIPSFINNLPVTTIESNAFENCELIKEINSDKLIFIGENAFKGCVNLTKISIKNIESIGNNAFENCINLEDIIINNVKYIGQKAFYNNEKLLNVLIKDEECEIIDFALGFNNVNGVETKNPVFIIEGYYSSTAEDYANENNLTFKPYYELLPKYYYNTFINSSTGKKEAMITYVDRYLAGNFIIPSVLLDMEITRIDSQAFSDCSFITGLQLPETITTIGSLAFSGSGIKEINLEYVTKIESKAFYSCSQLENLYIPNITVLPDACFTYSGLVSIDIPNVISIGSSCFAQCTRLKRIYAPNVENLGSSSISSCYMLDNISFPKLTYLPNGAISACSSLTTCYLPELVEIDSANFNYCKSLEIINFLPKVEIIGTQCFYQTEGQRIREVYLPRLKSLSNSTFTDPPFADDDAILIFAVGKNITTFNPSKYNFNVDTIYGYSGTVVENYAITNNIKFVPLDDLEITNNLSSSKVVYQNTNENLIIKTKGFKQTYQWYETNSDIANGIAIEGETNISFNIDATEIGSRKYFVVVTNWDGTTIASNICEVSVVTTDNTRYKIVSTAIGNGQISQTGNVYVIEGSNKTFTFTSNKGYYIKSIVVDGVELSESDLLDAIENGYTFENITKDHTITVNFVIKTFTITVIQAENGTISEAEESYDYGSNAYFTITPNDGYDVEYLLIDGEEYTDSLDKYVFKNITSNHTISALFVGQYDIEYTVKYWFESLTQDGATLIGSKYYNLMGTDNSFYGVTGELTDVTAETVDGFTALTIEQKIIKGDASTVVDVLYDRNYYCVTLIKGEGISTVSGARNYLFGQTVELNATLLTGYNWASWISSDTNIVESSDNKKYSFEMPASNIEFTATAKKKQFTITIEEPANGTINPSINQIVNYGDDLELEFKADFGYRLDKVLVDGSDVMSSVVDNKYVLSKITKNYTVKAIFRQSQYTITATTDGNGKISPEGVSYVLYGEGLKYTFTPNTGYKVKDVEVNNVSYGSISSYTFTKVTSNQTISVEFEKITLTINVICGEHGSISPNGEVKVEYGGSVTFNINPDEGYGISYIELNNRRIDIKQKIVILDIIENKTLKVEFSKTFLITSISGENGTITPSSTIELGGQKRFDFYPNEGYKVKDVKIDNISIGAVDCYTFVNVDSSHVISVEYEIKKFNITLFVDGEGSVNNDKSLENVNYGEDINFTIYPDDGWKILKVYINGKSVDVKNNRLTISAINQDLNIQVIFEEKGVVFGFSTSTIAIIIGSIVISALLIILIIKSNKNAKIKRSMPNKFEQNNNYQSQNSNLQSNNHKNSEPVKHVKQNEKNPKLRIALNFVNGRKEDFILFCQINNIDYQNNYNDAVLKYYDFYLKSIR